jgi:hypothetical protein
MHNLYVDMIYKPPIQLSTRHMKSLAKTSHIEGKNHNILQPLLTEGLEIDKTFQHVLADAKIVSVTMIVMGHPILHGSISSQQCTNENKI